jgi:galactokinase
MMTDIRFLQTKFAELYDTPPAFIVRAPGRVNLIGEHTDYNDGFVFPAAINYDVTIACAPRRDRQARLYSLTFRQSTTFSLDEIIRSEEAPWSNYVRGVARILQDEGYALTGINAVVMGTVPIASGLSSSAAMEVASSLAFETAGGFDAGPVQRALLAQRAEREFVGMQCGIMDQFISALGKAGHALFIDTRTLEHEAVPLPEHGVALLIGNTNVPRELIKSAYNDRRRECEEAVELLKPFLPGIKALRDVSEEDFSRYADRLPEINRRRARHIITENARVLESIRALKAGDIAAFGRLMNASHDSLRDDYEVTGPNLDAMVAAARRVEGVFGARMTGAGFGGCTVSLVAEEAAEELQKRVGAEYREKTGLDATFYVSPAVDGANRIA